MPGPPRERLHLGARLLSSLSLPDSPGFQVLWWWPLPTVFRPISCLGRVPGAPGCTGAALGDLGPGAPSTQGAVLFGAAGFGVTAELLGVSGGFL